MTSGLPSERARSRSAAIARRTAGMPPAARRSAMGLCSDARLANKSSRLAVPGSKRGTVRRGPACGGVGREAAGCLASVRLRPPAGVPGRRVALGAQGRRSLPEAAGRPSAVRGDPPAGASSGLGRLSGLRSLPEVAGRPSAARVDPPAGAPSGLGRRSGLRSPPASSEPPPGCGRRASGRSPPRVGRRSREALLSPRRGLSSRSRRSPPRPPSERRTVVTA